MEILLSIITPCYNGNGLIQTAIESVLLQQNPQIEMLIVDDGSTDGLERVKEFYQAYPTIKWIQGPHGGAGRARNLALDQAKGKLIAFLDADDTYLPGSLSPDALHYLDEVVFGREGADILYTPRLQSDLFLNRPVARLDAEETIRHHMPALEFWTSIYRRAFLQEKKVRFYEYAKQDVETAFRYLAFSRTEHLSIRNDFLFVLQRENPYSNTHNFHFRNLYAIKAQIYADLLKQSNWEEDKEMLTGQVRLSLENYEKACKKDGVEDVEQHRRMQALGAAFGEAIHEAEAYGSSEGKKVLPAMPIYTRHLERISQKLSAVSSEYVRKEFGQTSFSVSEEAQKRYQESLNLVDPAGKIRKARWEKEGRIYDLVFDASYYLGRYPDLQAAYGEDSQAAFGHFLQYGMKEGRQGCLYFDMETYRSRYPDLQAAYGEERERYYLHYLDWGYGEGRRGNQE